MEWGFFMNLKFNKICYFWEIFILILVEKMLGKEVVFVVLFDSDCL